MTDRPPLPPFDRESALTKVQAAEDAWNTRDPERVAGAYTVDSAWRNRDAFFTGRPAAASPHDRTAPSGASCLSPRRHRRRRATRRARRLGRQRTSPGPGG